MAVAAEIERKTPSIDQESSFIIEAQRPWALNVAELDVDQRIREEAAQFIGRALLAEVVENSETLKRDEGAINSLLDGIHLANKGNENAKKMVRTNVETDVIERTLKAGHVTDPIPLEVTPDGKIVQYDQTGDSIQANSLQLAASDRVMLARTKAETRNKFRTEELNRLGWLDEHSLVVFSLAEDMPDIFFTETMSCSIQVTSKVGNGLQLESAFVAGVNEEDAPAHDIETIIKVGDLLGVDFRNKTKAEILDMPLLVPNEIIKNGAIDIVKLWDEACDGFFWENKPAPMSYE
jgi:hypothetical protein